jgi:hypothetical protein
MSGVNLDAFKDDAFKDGLLKRSQAGIMGDPVGSGKIGDPKNWVIGGPSNEADVVVLLAGDDLDSLNREVARVVATLLPALDGGDQPVRNGASVLFRQDGATLTGPLRGHEHFGFRDGISQPGVRAKLPDGSFLTPNQNPLDVNQGKPGQDLLWPGRRSGAYREHEHAGPSRRRTTLLETFFVPVRPARDARTGNGATASQSDPAWRRLSL